MTDTEALVRAITDEVLRQLGASGASGCAGGTCACPGPDASPRDIEELALIGATRIQGKTGMSPLRPDLARLIDHTLLKPDATYAMIETLCEEARRHRFYSVCVNPCWVAHCARLLHGSGVCVCTVIGFPLGATTSDIKAIEAKQAQEHGATELDMVINIGALKTGDVAYVERDIKSVVDAARAGVIVKVILETALLTDAEKISACEAAVRAGAHFVKTSTGFSTGGATPGDIALMRRIVGESMGVKASGGVGDCETADAMVKSGASRIGASAGIKIVSQCGTGAAKKSAY